MDNKMMMVMSFNFDGLPVKAIHGEDGSPWFIGNDIAKVLGYAAPRNAVRDHCKGGIKTMLPTEGGMQQMTIIPERDMYRLIMRSKLPAAERFEEWVVGKVLPEIRKTGGFGGPKADLEVLRGMVGDLVTERLKVDTRVAALDRISTKEMMDQARISTKGRRRLGLMATASLKSFCAANGGGALRHASTNTWLWPVETARAWYKEIGKQMFQEHVDAMNKQMVFIFKDEKDKRKKG